MKLNGVSLIVGLLGGLGLLAGGVLLTRWLAGRREGRGRARRQDVRNAGFIGNVGTRVYHAATDPHLPREDRRVYFSSAEEAEATGYRAAGQRA